MDKAEEKVYKIGCLTLLHSEWPKLHRVFAILSAIGLKTVQAMIKLLFMEQSDLYLHCLNLQCMLQYMVFS